MHRRSRPLLVVLAFVALMVVGACGGGSAPTASVDPSPSPSPEPTMAPVPSVDPEGELCVYVNEMGFRLEVLQAVELKLTNRVALDIELDKLMVAYNELDGADLGDRKDELDRSLTRLGYRLRELEMAVEDFRTNTRPRRAVPNVEGDTQAVFDELAAFLILSRC